MHADNLERRFDARKSADLEKRIADLERLVSWLTGLLIDLVAVGLGVAGAIFVAGDYYRLSAVDGSVALAFVVTMLSANFIFRKGQAGVWISKLAIMIAVARCPLYPQKRNAPRRQPFSAPPMRWRRHPAGTIRSRQMDLTTSERTSARHYRSRKSV